MNKWQKLLGGAAAMAMVLGRLDIPSLTLYGGSIASGRCHLENPVFGNRKLTIQDAYEALGGKVAWHGKPHPEPYLRAAALLGVEPNACVAFEDSPAGITSAEAAGTHAIGVPHFVNIPAKPGRNRVGSLLDIDFDLLRRVRNGDVVDLLQD